MTDASIAVAALTLAIALSVGVLFRLLKLSERARLERLRRRKTFESVQTSTPLSDPLTVAVRRATDSIQLQYRNLRRLLFPLAVLVGVVLAVMPYLPAIPATLLSVGLGAATVLAGAAAKPFVENLIAGLVMGVSRVLNIGDTVIVREQYATVEDITMTHTTLKLWDWRRLVVPNSQMLATEFLNYSLNDLFIWAYIEFWVDYDVDLDLLEELAREATRQSPYFADYEPPQLWVMDCSKEGVKCWLAGWANSPNDAWYLKSDMRKGLVKAFQRKKIETHRFRITQAL